MAKKKNPHGKLLGKIRKGADKSGTKAIKLPGSFFSDLAKERELLKKIREDAYNETGVWVGSLDDVEALLQKATVKQAQLNIKLVTPATFNKRVRALKKRKAR